MIKTSRHTIKFTNTTKQLKLQNFLNEYRRVAQVYLDYLWNNEVKWNNKILNVSKQQYDCPTFISTIKIPLTTTLSARALKCCSTQVCGIVKAILEKPRKRLFKLQELQKQNKDCSKLQNKIRKHPITKPIITQLNPELNSICCDLLNVGNHFDSFLQLKSIGKSYGKIRIPIKHHRHSNKLKSKGKLLNSILITDKEIQLRWEIPKVIKKSSGCVVGADQGIKTVLTLSNSTTTPLTDNHGHSFDSIIKRLSRKKKGSKAFTKTQQLRINFINWSLNQLNLKNIKQINFENIVNIGFKNKRSRYLSHFTNTLIRDKLLQLCDETGVTVTLQSSVYRSQRCSGCGLVRKANRKGKNYTCSSCGLNLDADLNAAKNHEQTLPSIPFALRKLNLNLKGFIWKPNGFYDLTGKALTVPSS